ncbi:hypothetical protein NL676_033417 [Syzygium grande]|nr:hypothetical protein NL676_033417 [Syzygium grande]
MDNPLCGFWALTCFLCWSRGVAAAASLISVSTRGFCLCRGFVAALRLKGGLIRGERKTTVNIYSTMKELREGEPVLEPKSNVGGGAEDVYGEDHATEDQFVTPWALSVARFAFFRSFDALHELQRNLEKKNKRQGGERGGESGGNRRRQRSQPPSLGNTPSNPHRWPLPPLPGRLALTRLGKALAATGRIMVAAFHL